MVSFSQTHEEKGGKEKLFLLLIPQFFGRIESTDNFGFHLCPERLKKHHGAGIH